MGNTPESDDDGTPCVVCGDNVEEAIHRRVISRIEDGQAVHRHFCTDDCLLTWTES